MTMPYKISHHPKVYPMGTLFTAKLPPLAVNVGAQLDGAWGVNAPGVFPFTKGGLEPEPGKTYGRRTEKSLPDQSLEAPKVTRGLATEEVS